MGRKQRGEEKRGSLLDFLGVSEEKAPEKKPAERATDTIKIQEKPEEASAGGATEAIYSYISSKRSITKDELFEWGKAKGYTVAEVMKAVDLLVKSGKIKRRLDDEGRLVYTTP
ncbi:MAG: hypothetical protein ABWJ97_06810 [Thermoproteus sp.]